ncbi:hypothetical protein GGR57DRAFT_391317 [Xylariaceae sp. FL1272]|nr:hypothetical protein GGR57DRAFT_391317 [Xylariaceae sp. FL1272]
MGPCLSLYEVMVLAASQLCPHGTVPSFTYVISRKVTRGNSKVNLGDKDYFDAVCATDTFSKAFMASQNSSLTPYIQDNINGVDKSYTGYSTYQEVYGHGQVSQQCAQGQQAQEVPVCPCCLTGERVYVAQRDRLTLSEGAK